MIVTDEFTPYFLNLFNKKYEEELVDALRINFEFFTFKRICDHALITSSLIFLKLLNEPKVMKLFFSKVNYIFFYFSKTRMTIPNIWHKNNFFRI